MELFSGEIVIKPKFDSCRPFTEGLAAVEIGDTMRYIDQSGNTAIHADFYQCNSFAGGLALVMPDMSSSAFINRSGKTVMSGRNYLTSRLSDGLINCPEKGKWGYINVHGEFKIPPQYVYARPFREGVAAVARDRDDAFSFIDSCGEVVIDGEFHGADIEFSENLCGVWNESFGFIDRSGQVVIPYQFEFADHFSEGLAVVKETDSDVYGYIDKTGTVVIPAAFACAEAFEGELAQVVVGEEFESYRYGYIDRTGKFVWKPTR